MGLHLPTGKSDFSKLVILVMRSYVLNEIITCSGTVAYFKLQNEAMTGTHTQNPVYSRLTLALMEDTGQAKNKLLN